ncbi:hypothetical protein ACFFHJ_40410 [Planotetraspora thailandica]|nr:hypothetical protein [Planotetraspora thailandica]
MRKLQALRPDHVARRTAGRVAGLADQFKDFAVDVRRQSASRETELRAQLRLDSVETRPTRYDDVKDGR